MADFNVEMSPAQHAGANTVAPVQVSPVPNFDINPFIEKGLSIFAKLGEDASKRKAEEQSNAVIQQYIEQENSIAEQTRAGTIDSSRAGTLSRSNYQKFIASNPGLIKALSEARRNIYEGTETGEIADEVKIQKEQLKVADSLASEFGFDMSQNMSPETRKARHEAAYAMKRNEKALQRMTAEQSYTNAGKAEGRADYDFRQKVADKEMVNQSEVLLKEMVSKNFDAFSSRIQDLVTNATTPEQIQQAQLAINMELGQYKAMAASAAQGPGRELVNTYLGAFTDLASFATTNMKPGVKLETYKQQYEERIAFAKLMFTQNPQTTAAVAANSMVPNAIQALTAAQVSITENLTKVSGALPNTPLYQLPQVVGAQGEKATFDATKEAIDKLNRGIASGDLPKLTKEINQSIDVYSRQADQMVKSEGFDPRHLDKLMDFFSQDDVGKAIAAGKISPTQQKAMSNALGAYSEAVVKSVTATLGQAAQDTGQRKSGTIGEYVSDIKFEGGKLSLYPSKGYGSKDGSAAAQEALKKSEAALTRIVRVGAHNDGTTDYGAWWEKNRHHVMPNVYADPERFPAGFVNEKTGYKFKGGMWTNPNNWEKVPSGPKQ